jgi:hypothetical protein
MRTSEPKTGFNLVIQWEDDLLDANDRAQARCDAIAYSRYWIQTRTMQQRA